jgi:uncharacterized membrane protein
VEKACIKHLHLFHFTNDPTHEKKKKTKKTSFYKMSSRKRSFYKNKCKIKFSNGMKKRKENNITNEILYA